MPLTSQEKRFRSMQEHIRRAHPEHYISKLPATEDSFQLMINTPPSERPPPPQPSSSLNNSGAGTLFLLPRPLLYRKAEVSQPMDMIETLACAMETLHYPPKRWKTFILRPRRQLLLWLSCTIPSQILIGSQMLSVASTRVRAVIGDSR